MANSLQLCPRCWVNAQRISEFHRGWPARRQSGSTKRVAVLPSAFCITQRAGSAPPHLQLALHSGPMRLEGPGGVSALCRAAGPAPGVICEPLVVLGDPQHHSPRVRVRQLVGDAARFLGALEPVLGVVENGAGCGHLHGPLAAKRRNDTVRGGVAQHVDRRHAYLKRMPSACRRMPEARQ